MVEIKHKKQHPFKCLSYTNLYQEVDIFKNNSNSDIYTPHNTTMQTTQYSQFKLGHKLLTFPLKSERFEKGKRVIMQITVTNACFKNLNNIKRRKSSGYEIVKFQFFEMKFPRKNSSIGMVTIISIIISCPYQVFQMFSDPWAGSPRENFHLR